MSIFLFEKVNVLPTKTVVPSVVLLHSFKSAAALGGAGLGNAASGGAALGVIGAAKFGIRCRCTCKISSAYCASSPDSPTIASTRVP